jgi:hypothetical protein
MATSPRPRWSPGVGIGSRVRMIFKTVASGLALPLWTLDEAARSRPHPGAIPSADDRTVDRVRRISPAAELT